MDFLDFFVDPPEQVQITDVFGFDTKHANLYAYSYINYIKNVTFTVGASADFFEDEDSDKNQLNPKFGVTWNPVPDTTLRAAVFRVLKRTLITNQTLEPTQVAGFNQFFDDQNRTESWRYGIAVDQKFTRSIYGGAEYSLRDLEVPFFDITTGEMTEVDWDEKLARVYLYWTPHEWVALSTEYSYERSTREKLTLNAGDVKTHRVPLGCSFHHPSGLSSMVRVTYYDQEGDFERLSAPPGVFESGEDNFWLVDVAISYRLPKRYGFITVGAKNLFDEDFMFFDTDRFNPSIQPDRMFFARATLSI
jgi:outer membrane receptor protein involved in Fe transport